MNPDNLDMTELATDYVPGSLISMTVFAIFSFMFFFGSLILFWINQKNSLREVKRLSYIDGYVNSMVHTYFYGYLKKIIPDEGTGRGGLYEKIKFYKETQNLTDKDFPFHKIFIIICASGFVPTTLDKIDEKRIKPRKHLEPMVLNRAGTNGRHYTTAVYKVKYSNLKDHITVAMEGAPPLLTMLDASAEDHELKENKKLIVEMFYKKLAKKLAEHREFANSYELVFYNDDPDKPPTLAEEIILRHVDGRVFFKEHEGIEYPPSPDSVNENNRLFFNNQSA